jgi:DNA-binding MarR family transcriptional regulator
MAEECLDPEAEKFVALLRQLIRQVFALDPEDPSTDLPVAQLRVCALLSDGPLTVTALANELDISVSAATQVADRLEAAELATRVTDEEDRRVRNLVLTPQGEALTQRRRTRRIQAARALLGRLTPEERQGVLSALAALTSTPARPAQ